MENSNKKKKKKKETHTTANMLLRYFTNCLPGKLF